MTSDSDSAKTETGSLEDRGPLTSIEDIQRDVSRIAQSLGRVSVPEAGGIASVGNARVKVANSSVGGTSAARQNKTPSITARVAEIARLLENRVASCTSHEECLQQCGQLLSRHLSFVGHYRPAGNRIGDVAQLDGLTAPLHGLDKELQRVLSDCCDNAARTSQRTVAEWAEDSRILAVPVQGSQSDVLVGIASSESAEPGFGSLLLDLTAVQLTNWLLRDNVTSSDRGSRHVAALMELTAHLNQCRDIRDGAGRLSRELQRYLHAERVVVGYCEDADSSCVLISDTAQTTVNPLTEETQLIQAALEESIARQTASVWPPEDNERRHALLAHRQLDEFLNHSAVVSCPLSVDEEKTIGAVLLLFGDDATDSRVSQQVESVESSEASRGAETATVVRSGPTLTQTALQFLNAAAGSLAATLALLDRTAPGLWQYLYRNWRKIYSEQRRRAAGVVVAASLAVMLLPLHYQIDCDAELQPVSRRFVAAPFDGTLQECLVRPGDYVRKDMLLALMDEREIEYELAGIQADVSRARTERNTHRAGHKFSDAAIAGHEVERLQQRSELLAYRSDNLELRSPIDGIVVAGDHKDAEGVPLKTGESLFEIAPLDTMTIEVSVPEEDIRWVRPGMPMSLQLDAMPADVVQTRVLRIHPSAELRDHENVFIVEAEIANADSLYRPGMRGSVTIESDRHSFGWNLFHKPGARLIGWLGW